MRRLSLAVIRVAAVSVLIASLPVQAAGGSDKPTSSPGDSERRGGETGVNPASPAAAKTEAAPPLDARLADEASRLVYSVNRTPERPFDTGRAVQVITAEDIWRKNARNLPEMLMEEAGIFVQQTNYGGGSPIVRGLMGKQLVILVDGVRVNNATFRFGPVQYLNTIDLSAVERIEIVRGVESVLGSDSLGGLINIVMKKGPRPEDGRTAAGSVTTRFSTGDMGVTTHAELFGRISRLRYAAGGTFRRSEDFTAGANLGVQREQGYDERAGSLSAEYALSENRTLSARYHSLSQDDVPGATKTATTTYLVTDPQRLKLLTVEFQDLTKRPFFDQLQVTGFLNTQEEGQVEIRSNAPALERRNYDYNRLFGTSVQMASYGFGSHRLLYGFDYSRERITSTFGNLNVFSGAIAPGRGKYTNGAGYQQAAFYLQDRFDVTRWVTMTMGARYGRTSASGTENSSVAVLDLGSSQRGITGSLGVVGHLTSSLNLAANVTRGFRPPNIEDLSRYDERKEGVEVPNPALKPEQSLTYEFGLKYNLSRFDGSVFYYNSALTDLHDRRGGMSNGLDFFDLNGNGRRDSGEPNVLQRVNVGRARIRGVEVDGRLRLASSFTLSGNYTTTRGDDWVLNEPLSRIPPAFGRVALRWTPSRVSRRIWSEAGYTFANAQRRVSTRDKGDARIGATGTDGFGVFNLRGGFDVTRMVRVSLEAENILNEGYKYHASGIYRPGRQFVLGTQFLF